LSTQQSLSVTLRYFIFPNKTQTLILIQQKDHGQSLREYQSLLLYRFLCTHFYNMLLKTGTEKYETTFKQLEVQKSIFKWSVDEKGNHVPLERTQVYYVRNFWIYNKI